LIMWAAGQLADQTNSALETRDWLVPAISGAAGVLGALGAQAVGKRAQINVEQLRGSREFLLAERREWHAQEAEKRAARGIAAALTIGLEYKKVALEGWDTAGIWWPDGLRMEVELGRTEQVALAAWVGDPAWGVIVAPIESLKEIDKTRAEAAANGEAYTRGRFQPTMSAIELAVGALRSEIDSRLQSVPAPTAQGQGG